MTTKSWELKFATSSILLQIGIPYHLCGSKYLVRAVEITVAAPDAIRCITQKIYQQIALEFGTKSANVERAIRHAIDGAWHKKRLQNLNKIFNINVFLENDRPCNGELIAFLANRIPYVLANQNK